MQEHNDTIQNVLSFSGVEFLDDILLQVEYFHRSQDNIPEIRDVSNFLYDRFGDDFQHVFLECMIESIDVLVRHLHVFELRHHYVKHFL